MPSRKKSTDLILCEVQSHREGNLIASVISLLTRAPVSYTAEGKSRITIPVASVTARQFEAMKAIAESASRLLAMTPDVFDRKFYVEDASGDRVMELQATNILEAFEEAMQESDATVQEDKSESEAPV